MKFIQRGEEMMDHRFNNFLSRRRSPSGLKLSSSIPGGIESFVRQISNFFNEVSFLKRSKTKGEQKKRMIGSEDGRIDNKINYYEKYRFLEHGNFPTLRLRKDISPMPGPFEWSNRSASSRIHLRRLSSGSDSFLSILERVIKLMLAQDRPSQAFYISDSAENHMEWKFLPGL
ncbi:hypothetical protein Tco_0347611 [Tanacetum coccineum]